MFTNEQELILKIADSNIVTACSAVGNSYEGDDKKEYCNIKIVCGAALNIDYDPVFPVPIDLLEAAQ